MTRHHELKCERRYFDRIKSGQKQFEIRKNDRDFQVGDTVTLTCIEDGTNITPPHVSDYINGADKRTKMIELEIIYVSDYAQQDGWVVFGFKINNDVEF